MLRLYDYWSSSAAYRVRIALALKGRPYERVVVRRLDGVEDRAYWAVNPQGFVPTLEDGGVRLVQSTAILEYLEERYPEPPLLPADAAGRARVRAIVGMVAADIQPLNNQRVQDALLAEFGLDEAGLRRWYAKWIAEGFAALERFLADDPAHGQFLPRRPADARGRLPRAAGVQRAPLVVRPGALPDAPADRRGLRRPAGVRRGAAGAAERLSRLTGARQRGSILGPD